jgi:hypothetical protein
MGLSLLTYSNIMHTLPKTKKDAPIFNEISHHEDLEGTRNAAPQFLTSAPGGPKRPSSRLDKSF